ncbi:hypothetical protein [Gimesia sp.]|uniref:hypothetical protein n=1 Tax=Gimesia sp. TaxID=2024833 RepID=UPI003A9025A4
MSNKHDSVFRLYNGGYFGGLALINLSNMEKALIERSKVKEAEKQKLIDHEEAEYEKHLIEDTIKDSAVSTILFAGMAAEAYIYDYSARKIGKAITDDHLDNLKAESKWLIVTQLVTGNTFPKDKIAFCLLKKLIKARNSLVHSKSKHISMADLSIEEVSKNRDDLIENSRSAVRALYELGKQIEDLDSNEKSIFLLGVSSYKPAHE